MRAYTAEEIDALCQQLRAITVGDKRVLTVIVSKAVMTEYHVIYVDTGVGTQTLEFRKAKEGGSNDHNATR